MKRLPPRSCGSLLALTIVVLAASATRLAGQDGQASSDGTSEAQLVAVLQSDASDYQKVVACKGLARAGTGVSVPVLASLLSDEELSHPARVALEAISDPAAGAALRRSVSELNGELLIGVIHSIGARRDSDAVETLEGLVTGSDPAVAAAAAWALGSIGTAEAARVAVKRLGVAAPTVRAALGDACLQCAEAAHDRGVAARLYHAIRRADLPAHIRLAAVRGAILTDESNRNDLLNQQLAAEDAATFATALGVSREVTETAVTQLLTDQYSNLPPDRQALLVLAVGDRNDPAALPTVTEAAASEHVQVRLAALRALSELGDASTLPLLFEAAGDSQEAIAATALDTLAAMTAAGVDASITDRLRQSKGNPPQHLLDLAGRRRIAAAAPDLIGAAESESKPIRIAAIKALGETIPSDRIAFLRGEFLTIGDTEEAEAVEQALRAACVRLAGEKGEQCSKQLVAALPEASTYQKTLILDLLRILGGDAALQAVSELALDDDVQLQDTATRILGEWMTPDAAPVLLRVSQTLGASKFGIRAMRGYIRIIRQFDVPDDERLAMCQKGLELAHRDDERRLLLDALGRIPRAGSLALIEEYLDKGPLNEAACAAAVNVAEKIAGQDSDAVVAVMRKVVETTVDEEVARRARELLP